MTGLELIAGNYSGHLNINIEARSTEVSNGDYAIETRTLNVDVVMLGDANNNQLMGDAGNNIIEALAGNDTLIGNTGNDILSGGFGADTFDYNSNNDGHDTITDFDLSAGDKIDIANLLDYQLGDTLTDFVTVENTDGNTIVSINTNGNGESDVSVTLSNTTLSFEDLSNMDAFVVL